MSEPTTPAADTTDGTEPTTDQQPTDSHETADTDWKSEARKWEDRSKKNAAAAKQARDLEAKLAEFENKDKSETEQLSDRATKAEERAASLEGKYRELVKQQAVTEAALAAKTVDPETVFALIKGDVEVDDDGTVTGHTQAIARLQKSKPYLFQSPSAGARDASTPSQPPALNSSALEDALRAAVGA